MQLSSGDVDAFFEKRAEDVITLANDIEDEINEWLPEQPEGSDFVTDIRKKYLDLDTRPRAVSDHHCYRCLKTIRPGSKYRLVHVIDGGWHAPSPRR